MVSVPLISSIFMCFSLGLVTSLDLLGVLAGWLLGDVRRWN